MQETCVLEQALWAEAAKGVESPVFRKEFTVSGAVKAKLTICGLGFFEAFLNGGRVGEDLLVPAWSDYEPRENRRILYPINDTFSHRVYYLEYDVTAQIREGKNALGVWLGNGWYNQRERLAEGELYYGNPKLCFVLEWENVRGGRFRVISDGSLLWKESEIQKTNIYLGEVHDLRRKPHGFSLPQAGLEGWKKAVLTPAPRARLIKQACPADRVIRSIQPTEVLAQGDRRIYDCGENISGHVVLRLAAQPGQEAEVLYSEEWNPDQGTLNFYSAACSDTAQRQCDRYTASHQEERVHPHFTWHGFRYFQVTGCAQVESVAVVHGHFPVTSSFSSSSKVLNWLYQAYVRSQLDNIHCGVPSDCPHRERLGYTGDGQITAAAAMLTLDVRRLYDKWMEDIVDGQDPVTGHVQHTAPFYGGGGGPGGWGGAVYRIPTAYYRMYGDEGFLRKYYPNMRLWLDYMESRCDNGLVTREEKDGWCLGEWCTPERVEIPEPFVNTYYYIKGLQEVLAAARLLGIGEDTALLERRLTRCENAMREAYQDPKTGSFCKGVNAADAFALDIGLGTPSTLDALLAKYRKEPKLDTGMFGTDVLIDVLFENGEADLAYTLLTARTDASFARAMDAGATTLWETWDGGCSHNHPMFGGVVRSLFGHILGIRQKPGTAGFADVEILPADIKELDWAEGSIQTPRGDIWVRWERQADGTRTVNVRMG